MVNLNSIRLYCNQADRTNSFIVGAVKYVMVRACVCERDVYPSGVTEKSGTRETGTVCY